MIQKASRQPSIAKHQGLLLAEIKSTTYRREAGRRCMTSLVDESLMGILFVIPTLGSGGAQRACINYINNLRGCRRFKYPTGACPWLRQMLAKLRRLGF